jgi:predicted RNA-binding protein with PIN domain
MPYFLDGNNLIGRARKRSHASEEDRAALVSEVAERLRRTKARAVLFFDGEGERNSVLGSLSVRTSAGSSADDAIVREIERARAPGEIVVVSADRGLARRVRDLGAKTLGPEEFWSRVGVSKGPEARGSGERVDVEEWMRYFQDEGNRKR